MTQSSVGTKPEAKFERQARLCRALANPLRLWILDLLRSGECSAGDLRETLGLSRVLLSQHMSILERQHVVRVRREKNRVYYRLADPVIAEACHVVCEAVEQLGQRAEGVSPGAS